MRILMIAPEPFFEPRGTPFSEYHRIRALLELGHSVDLVTYPFGQSVDLPGLRVFRCPRPPFLRRVGIGPSFAKVPLARVWAWIAMEAVFSNWRLATFSTAALPIAVRFVDRLAALAAPAAS